MTLCFDVVVNDDAPVLAGGAEAEVLLAGLIFFRERAEIDLHVGGVERSDHVDWMNRELKRGDVVTIRIIESEQLSPPIRRRTGPTVDAEQERAYYERLRRKYEPENE